ncbi:sigma-70 family RNA polymerase sigma factor [Phytohabitans flavus]|uniref:sigma-70 family RNA polymerase sigma factor n=1 Tax=Phytohabitans flavus TaxID=1076124 RepID=UPI00362AC695
MSTWRRRRVVETMPGELPERRDHADHAHNAVERLALRRALQALPARQRAVVILRYFEDYSEAETADILNCRVGTVKSHTARALSKLRELMPEIELSEGVTR